MALENLSPIVREERLLAGEDLEPANRLEYFLKQAGSGGGGGSGLMYFDISLEGTLPNQHYVSSKTYTELMSAISSGMLPIAKYYFINRTIIFTLSSCNETQIEFSSTIVMMPGEQSTDPPAVSVDYLSISNTDDVFIYNAQIFEA